MEETLAVESAAGEAPAAVAPEREEETLEEVLSRHRSVAASFPMPAVDWAIELVPSLLDFRLTCVGSCVSREEKTSSSVLREFGAWGKGLELDTKDLIVTHSDNWSTVLTSEEILHRWRDFICPSVTKSRKKNVGKKKDACDQNCRALH